MQSKEQLMILNKTRVKSLLRKMFIKYYKKVLLQYITKILQIQTAKNKAKHVMKTDYSKS